ncbi:efflux RND transporter periplasmic adaptor subunit [Mesohalobacter halotolerans]|uniref:Efflux RND transporter periplasmic adaptor subunit n=1 Tax=Mesohalobacter halotolerans TaxID=1883405 RepID=A0A4U5TTR9_9FLAO|nr:efflux RND transporter periplasmic adaptor subunit [Mesohalobacter halotolerans]TKS56688.1 efflux RND transporter periplasmic adaptor subunit [Mesohalobacter halotolerans]
MSKIINLFIFSFLLLSCNTEETATQSSPPKVQVVSLDQQEVTLEKDFVGQVYGYNDIPIRTRVAGVLEKIAFQEGSYVNKGDLLYEVDPDLLLESLNAAKSDLARSQVNQDKAISDLNRIKPLAEINAVSQRDLDAAIAAKKSADEMVKAAQAKLSLAQIRLDYASIEAPVDGIIGKSMAGVGEFVGKNPNPVVLNTVSTIDSLRVEFFVTENDYLDWQNRDLSKDDKTIKVPLKLVLSNGEVFPHKGKINFINREVDNVTGTILVQALFPNPDRLVRPGQFARVRAAVQSIPDALLIPQRCINEVQGNYFAMRVDKESKVEQVPIQLGQDYRDYFIVQDGLSPGDKVIIAGLQRAKSGSKVQAESVEFTSQYKED